jgi:hypothetical protein
MRLVTHVFFRCESEIEKGDFNFFMSVLCDRTEQLGSNRMDFHEIWYMGIFSKKCWENSRFIKIWQE